MSLGGTAGSGDGSVGGSIGVTTCSSGTVVVGDVWSVVEAVMSTGGVVLAFCNSSDGVVLALRSSSSGVVLALRSSPSEVVSGTTVREVNSLESLIASAIQLKEISAGAFLFRTIVKPWTLFLVIRNCTFASKSFEISASVVEASLKDIEVVTIGCSI